MGIVNGRYLSTFAVLGLVGLLTFPLFCPVGHIKDDHVVAYSHLASALPSPRKDECNKPKNDLGLTVEQVQVIAINASYLCDPKREFAFKSLQDARPLVKYAAIAAWFSAASSPLDVAFAAEIMTSVSSGRFPENVRMGKEGYLVSGIRKKIFREGILVESVINSGAFKAAGVLTVNNVSETMPLYTWVPLLRLAQKIGFIDRPGNSPRYIEGGIPL